MVTNLHPIDQLFEGHSGISRNSYLSLYIFIDFGGIYLDVDNFSLRGEFTDIPRDPIVKSHPDRNQYIAFCGFDVGGVVSVHSQHTHVERVIIIQYPHSMDGPGNWYVCLFDKFSENFLSPRNMDAVSSKDIRFFGLVDQLCSSIQLIVQRFSQWPV